MTANRQSILRRLTSGIIAGAALAVYVLTAHSPALAQEVGTNDHWVGTWATAVVARPQTAPQAPAPFEPSAAGNNLPNRLTGSFVSAARGGIKTNWVIALPPGHRADAGTLRPVIALHGKDGNASQMLEIGVEDGLTQLVKAGKPPFAVVGVDGGNTYWHRRASGGDSGAMVLEELLPMLAAMAWVCADAMLLLRTGNQRYAVTGLLVYFGGLLCFEKAAVIPFVAFTLYAGVLGL